MFERCEMKIVLFVLVSIAPMLIVLEAGETSKSFLSFSPSHLRFNSDYIDNEN